MIIQKMVQIYRIQIVIIIIIIIIYLWKVSSKPNKIYKIKLFKLYYTGKENLE